MFLKVLVLSIVIILMLVMVITKNTSTLSINLDSSAVEKGIMLSEQLPLSGNDDYKVILKATPIVEAWNISGDWIPDDVHTVDGNNSTEEYLAYSFYVVNRGRADVNLIFSVNVERAAKRLDETIRVKIFFDDNEPNVYAKLALDGTPEPGTIPFETNNSIIGVIGSMKPEEYTRVSIIVWIEGDDPDTTNDKIGGSISLNATFKIIE